TGRPCRISRIRLKCGLRQVDNGINITSSFPRGRPSACPRGLDRRIADGSARHGCRSMIPARPMTEGKGVPGLMRRGRREVLLLSMVFLLGAAARGARFEGKKTGGGPDESVGITIELSWTAAASQPRDAEAGLAGPRSSAVILGVTEGRVADVIAWP